MAFVHSMPVLPKEAFRFSSKCYLSIPGAAKRELIKNSSETRRELFLKWAFRVRGEERRAMKLNK